MLSMCSVLDKMDAYGPSFGRDRKHKETQRRT